MPHWLLDADVSASAIRLYAVLMREAKGSHWTAPGKETLMERARCAHRTLYEAVAELHESGALLVQACPGRRTRYRPLLRPAPAHHHHGDARPEAVSIQTELPLGGGTQTHRGAGPKRTGGRDPNAPGPPQDAMPHKAYEPPLDVDLEEPENTEANASVARVRREDLAFVALAEITGFDYRGLTRPARSELNAALRDIRQAAPELNGELPAEIRVRAGRYAAAHPKWDLTPSALAKWWPTLTRDRPPPRGRDRAREIVERAFDKAARARGGGDGTASEQPGGPGADGSSDRSPAGVLPG